MTITIRRSIKCIHFHEVEGLFHITLLDVKVFIMFKITDFWISLIESKSVKAKKKKVEA